MERRKMVENNGNCSKNTDKNSGLSGDANGYSGGGKKENLLDFTKQLVSLGALQQAIVRNLQREIENLKS
jgi:hypothetical protein